MLNKCIFSTGIDTWLQIAVCYSLHIPKEVRTSGLLAPSYWERIAGSIMFIICNTGVNVIQWKDCIQVLDTFSESAHIWHEIRRSYISAMQHACYSQMRIYKVCIFPLIPTAFTSHFLFSLYFFLSCASYCSPFSSLVFLLSTVNVSLFLAGNFSHKDVRRESTSVLICMYWMCVYVGVCVCLSAHAWVNRALKVRLIHLVQLRGVKRSAQYNSYQFSHPDLTNANRFAKCHNRLPASQREK